MSELAKLAGTFATTTFSNASSGLGSALFGEQQARRNWRYRQKEMAKQQEYNLQNMQKQFEYQQEAWRKENSYNAPINAVARWRGAGIAPQAVYGNSPGGSGVAGSMSTPDSSNPSSGGNYDTSQYRPVMTLAEAQAMRNQKRLTDAEVRLKEAQADEANARATGQSNENSIFDLFKRAKEAAAGIAELDQKIKAIEAKWLEADKAKDMEIKDSILRETDQRISNLMADKAYKEQATEKLRSDMDLIKAQIATESSRQHNLDASTLEINASRELKQAERQRVFDDIRTMAVERDIKITESEMEAVDAWLKFQGLDRQSSLWGLIDKVRSTEKLKGRSEFLDFLKEIAQRSKKY